MESRTRSYRYSPLLALLLGVVSSPPAWSGGFESPGVGAKALGMGGAFVGLADDWTATYWNPAGLAQLEGAAVGTAIDGLFAKTFASNSIENPTPPLTRQNIEKDDVFVNLGGEPSHFNVMDSHIAVPLPALGAYYRWGRWVGAASVHTPLGFSSEMTDNTVPGLNISFKNQGYIVMSGLSLATEWKPGVYFGAGIHLLTSELEQHAVKVGPGYEFGADSKGSQAAVPEGVLGLLVKLTSRWRMGVVYRTPATLHLSGNALVADTRLPREQSDYTQNVYIPATYGVGMSYAIQSSWLVTADWQGTDWTSTRNKITFTNPGLILQNQDFDAGWGFTNRVRTGVQYSPSASWAFRAGVARDPQALPDEAQSLTNIIDITRYLYSAGIGWTSTSGFFKLDLTYQYGWGTKTIDGVDYARQSHLIVCGTEFHFK